MSGAKTDASTETGADSVKPGPVVARLEKAWFAFRPWAPWASLAFGLWNAFGVVRHYEQARWVAWMLAGMWGVFAAIAWIRHRARRKGSSRKTEIVVYLFSWASQSLSQEILFFVLPFWIRSTTWGSRNAPFTVLLLVLAASTLYDPLYMERIAGRTRLLLVHKALVAFAGLAFVVPALVGTHTVRALALAGALAGMATGFAIPGPRRGALVAVGLLAGGLLAAAAAPWIAPVPLRIEHGVFASGVRDKRPLDTLRAVRSGAELWAFTPVFAPAGLDDRVFHVWSRDGREVARVSLPLHGGRKEGFRTWSSSRRATAEPGDVELEVATADGQLVGTMTISVR